MNDTVTRLMALADKAIAAQDQRLGHLAQNYRQALEAELTRLFTPLSDEQMDALCIEAGNQLRAYCIEGRKEEPLSVGLLVEQAHGITGETK